MQAFLIALGRKGSRASRTNREDGGLRRRGSLPQCELFVVIRRADGWQSKAVHHKVRAQGVLQEHRPRTVGTAPPLGAAQAVAQDGYYSASRHVHLLLEWLAHTASVLPAVKQCARLRHCDAG